MYTVKEIAKLLELTEHTVRFYTDKVSSKFTA